MAVIKATGYGQDDLVSILCTGRGLSLRLPALGPTQCTVQRVPGLFPQIQNSRTVKPTAHLCLVSMRLKMCGVLPPFHKRFHDVFRHRTILPFTYARRCV
jgi:hypothetical protein